MIYIARFGLTGPYKIGCSDDVTKRIASIGSRLWDEVYLIRLFQGGRADEARLLRRFKPQRVRQDRYEWFHYHPDMMGDLGLTEITRQPDAAVTTMPQWIRERCRNGAEEYSDALRAWMIKKDLREDELARLVGCSGRSVTKWLKQGHPPLYKFQDKLRNLSDGEFFPNRVRLTGPRKPKARFMPLAVAS
jgi:hypothetical protein